MELKTPLTTTIVDQWTDVVDANGETLFVTTDHHNQNLAELVRRANAYDAMRAALNTIAFEPIGYADSSHRDVLDRITEIARDALAAAKGGA